MHVQQLNNITITGGQLSTTACDPRFSKMVRNEPMYTVPPAMCSVLIGSPGMYTVLCTHNIRENFVYIVKMMNRSVLWFHTHTNTDDTGDRSPPPHPDYVFTENTTARHIYMFKN